MSELLTSQVHALPMAIATYLERSVSAKPAAASQTFSEFAVVVDNGQTYTGQAAIASWLVDTAGEKEYTTTQLHLDRDNSATTIVNRVEGTFPGRRVELSSRFELDAESGLIRALTISLFSA